MGRPWQPFGNPQVADFQGAVCSARHTNSTKRSRMQFAFGIAVMLECLLHVLHQRSGPLATSMPYPNGNWVLTPYTLKTK